ncbi:hypothetical protein QR680_006018 [Steinernema hermaphroditum]|uniref:C-type lectin domain-containing protein n=1 Tax=Steinernema hermaphroditum TaxID=289476 RepID=A0AA39HU37_9BILA|nr:hypothetical protein QR680_006018 [Steinernema hermaphroditum]
MRPLLGALFFLFPLVAQAFHARTTCEYSKKGEDCFHFDSRFVAFSEAQDNCRALGGQLASIRNYYENQIVSHESYRLFHDLGVRSHHFWIGGVFSHSVWSWVDGFRLSYQNFGHPKDLHHPSFACLSIEATNGFNYKAPWVPLFCNHKAPFICELTKGEAVPTPTQPSPKTTTTTTEEVTTTSSTTKPTTTTTSTTTTTPAPTTTTTVKSDICHSKPCFEKHVYLVNHVRLSWSDAEKHCQSKGGHLASILSRDEGDFFASVIEKSHIGFDVWLGAHRIHNTFEWVDGSKWEYTNFHEDQPNDLVQNNCLEIFDASLRKWVNYDCEKKYPSICKVPL